MKNASSTRIGAAVALMAALAAGGTQAQASQQNKRGASGDQDYAELAEAVNTVGALSVQVKKAKNTAALMGESKNSPEILALKSKMGKALEQTGPKVVLTESISEADVGFFVDTLAEKLGTGAPAYISGLKGKAGYVHTCQKELMTPESGHDAALARAVSACAVAKYKENPVMLAPAAPNVAEAAPVGQAPVKPAVHAQAPAKQAAPAAAAPQKTEGGVSGVFGIVSPKQIGIGLGALAGLGGLIFAFARKKSAPQSAPKSGVQSAKDMKL